MTYIKILMLGLFQIVTVFAQISFIPDQLNFPQTFVHQSDSVLLKIINIQKEEISFYFSFTPGSDRFSSSVDSVSVSANDSSEIFIIYSPWHNVEDNGFLFIYNIDTTHFSLTKLIGSGKFPDNYYNSTFNLYDAQLKEALTNLTSGHTALGYNTARDKMFMEIDNKRVNGQGAAQNTVECVYTGREAVGYTSRSDVQTNYNFNTEHSYPQSMFSSNDPMVSDLFHLYPTDVNANSIRGNLPFGKVVSGINWQEGGSKRGNDSIGQLVFEPRDVHKGNLARTMIYFDTRYPQNYGGFFTSKQEKIFREWNLFDTVDTAERNRNNKIYTYQGKKNPFIDHPEFVERIYSFLGAIRPSIYEGEIYPAVLKFDSTAVGDTSSMNLYLVNTGNSEIFLNQITTQLSNFVVKNFDASILPGDAGEVEILFIPDTTINYISDLIVTFNSQILSASLRGIGKKAVMNVTAGDIQTKNFLLEQNYPNPFNPSTKIKFYIPQESFVQLYIYNVTGQLVKIIADENMRAGFHEFEFYAEGLSSGAYFYVLKSNGFYQTKSMILLK